MDIAKISGIRPGDWEVVDRAFASVEAQPIACCNWAETYPYAPDVQFRMFHTGAYLMLRFDVREQWTMARVTEDNGEVWTDSCVEFFIAPDTESYYNFETSCIGRLLLGYHRQGEKTVSAPAEALGSVIRHTSLPGTSEAKARPIAPLPAHRSTTLARYMPFLVAQSTPSCTTSSVSGRGMNTPGPTFKSR